MNGTEERLKDALDALDAVAETLRPGDVPPPRFADRRRARLPRRIAPIAAAASIAVAVGGGALAGGALGGGTNRAAAPPSPSATPVESWPHLQVFLCTRTNEACHGRAATPAEKRKVGERLKSMPIVERVDFVPKEEAYRRFKERFEKGASHLAESIRVGDMAEEYRVWVRDPGSAAALEKSATAVRRMLTGLPGVDQVHIEPKG